MATSSATNLHQLHGRDHALRADPAFKMAVGRLPESAADLCLQPTMCRLENLPGPLALRRMMAAMIELSATASPRCRNGSCSTDDTEDRVHGGQQLALFHAMRLEPSAGGRRLLDFGGLLAWANAS
jgi:hypothetical protein